MLRLALGFGVVAIGLWLWQRQSVRKGLGFTFHWWSLGDLVGGAMIALVAMTGIFLVELLLGSIRIVGFSWDLLALGRTAGWFIYGAFFEEFIFRSLFLSGLVAAFTLLTYLLARLNVHTFTGFTKWPAILLSAALFGLVHLSNENASMVSVFGNALGGLMYGIAFLGGRNIWLPVGLHFGWNFFQGALFGFPVSGTVHPSVIVQEAVGAELITGGAYGPEAGLVGMIFRFVVIALVLYYLWRRAGRRGDIKSLTYPIDIYANPTRAERKLVQQPSQA